MIGKENWGIRDRRKKLQSSRPQHNQYQQEYLGESWRPEKICYHSDCSEKSPVKTAEKKLWFGLVWFKRL